MTRGFCCRRGTRTRIESMIKMADIFACNIIQRISDNDFFIIIFQLPMCSKSPVVNFTSMV